MKDKKLKDKVITIKVTEDEFRFWKNLNKGSDLFRRFLQLLKDSIKSKQSSK